MGDSSLIAARFLNAQGASGELELILDKEIWDSTTDPVGRTIKNEEVEWHVYYIEARSSRAEMPLREEVGRTLYSKREGVPHPAYSPDGDRNAALKIYRVLARLSEIGVKARVNADTTELFSDVGTLAGTNLGDAGKIAFSKISSASNHSGYIAAAHDTPAN